MEFIAILLNVFVWIMIYFKGMHLTGFSLQPIFFSVISTILISIIFIDLKYYEIPNSYNALIVVLGLLYIYLFQSLLWSNYLLGGVIAFCIFFLIAIFTGGNLGMGDVKLVGGLGLFTGKFLLTNFFIATFLSGALISLFLLLFKVKKTKDKIAFGPYICFAFIYLLLTS